MHRFDYYSHHLEKPNNLAVTLDTSPERPMTYDELSILSNTGLAEIGCHGYYHQPLSKEFERYTEQEQSLSMSVFAENLGMSPRYYALANGMYTKRVVRHLLQTFTKVLTIDGTAFRPNDKVIHRLSLTNPRLSGSLSEQVAKSMRFARQARRIIRSKRRLLS